MRFDTLAGWLSWQESHHPSAIDLGLARVRQVAERLDLIRDAARFTVVTIAGTNGKGSAVATLESLLCHQGVAVGAYTSPHFHHYNERIRVNGEAADDGLIMRAFDAIDQQAQDVSLTYFEFGTLAALWIFRECALDYWLLEVGLGGRLDAVNIIDADAAIVTSIALDHQDWLGSDLQGIGREKAGIFRPGRLAIYADLQPVASVGAVAAELGCRFFQAGQDFHWQLADGRLSMDLAGQALCTPAPGLPLPSVVAACLCAVQLGLSLPPDWLNSVLPGLTVTGRHQRVGLQGRTLVLDVAHNPAACGFFLARAEAVAPANTHLVLAMMADKDAAGIVAPLLGRVGHWYLADLPGNPRAARAARLQSLLPAEARAGQFADVGSALQAALRQSAPGDTIWVLGSFFTVAAALAWLAEQNELAE